MKVIINRPSGKPAVEVNNWTEDLPTFGTVIELDEGAGKTIVTVNSVKYRVDVATKAITAIVDTSEV